MSSPGAESRSGEEESIFSQAFKSKTDEVNEDSISRLGHEKAKLPISGFQSVHPHCIFLSFCLKQKAQEKQRDSMIAL